MFDLKESLEKFVQEKTQPTEADRITALENALVDIAMMIVGVDNND